MRDAAVGGVVDRREWWRIVALHGSEPPVAALNGLIFRGSCDELDWDVFAMFWTMLHSKASKSKPFDQVPAVCGDDFSEDEGMLVS